MLSPLIFAAAVLGGLPEVPPPVPAPAERKATQPEPEQGEGGPYEPVEPATVMVEAEPVEPPGAFSIAPDPALARRYTPREREPLNRVTIPF